MSDEQYRSSSLVEFLRQAPEQGLLNSAVAKSRFAAVERVFAELSAEERRDIRLIDVESVCARLHKIEGSSIRPEVVDLYRSRVQAALTDYLAWVVDPKGFSSIGGEAIRGRKRTALSDRERSAEEGALEEIKLATTGHRDDMVSVPLRENLTVHIANLPLDLSAQEAKRIAGVIEALARPAAKGGSDAD
jgi:hypothetical protein